MLELTMKRYFQISLAVWLILASGLALSIWQLTLESEETDLTYTALIDVSGRTVTRSQVESRGPGKSYNMDPRTFRGKRVGWPLAYSQFGCHNGVRYNGLFDDYNSTNWLAVCGDLLVAMAATVFLLIANAMFKFRTTRAGGN